MSKRTKTVWLFGGGGYIGHYVAEALLLRGHNVVSYDKQNTLQIPHTFSIVDKTRNTNALLSTDTMDAFVHLACPRNKSGKWDGTQALKALRQGFKLSRHCAGPKIYISSMSVYDEPLTAYGVFKARAEHEATQHGFLIVRPGTVVGAGLGMPYRADLALHKIMVDWTAQKPCHVQHKARRHIIPVRVLAKGIALACDRPDGEVPRKPIEATLGVVSYCDIVPMTVSVRYAGDAGARPWSGKPADTETLFLLRNMLFDFVAAISYKENAAWPI